MHKLWKRHVDIGTDCCPECGEKALEFLFPDMPEMEESYLTKNTYFCVILQAMRKSEIRNLHRKRIRQKSKQIKIKRKKKEVSKDRNPTLLQIEDSCFLNPKEEKYVVVKRNESE